APLHEGVPPERACQHLVVTNIRYAFRGAVGLGEHKAPGQERDLTFAIRCPADDRSIVSRKDGRPRVERGTPVVRHSKEPAHRLRRAGHGIEIAHAKTLAGSRLLAEAS